MTTENLTTILNKLHAMHAAKIVTAKQIAKAIGSSEQRVGEWILRNGRDRRPNGEMAIRLLAFASDQTLKIAVGPRKLQIAYRSAYREIADRFPVNGKD